jgi:hypothetical protein
MLNPSAKHQQEHENSEGQESGRNTTANLTPTGAGIRSWSCSGRIGRLVVNRTLTAAQVAQRLVAGRSASSAGPGFKPWGNTGLLALCFFAVLFASLYVEGAHTATITRLDARPAFVRAVTIGLAGHFDELTVAFIGWLAVTVVVVAGLVRFPRPVSTRRGTGIRRSAIARPVVIPFAIGIGIGWLDGRRR